VVILCALNKVLRPLFAEALDPGGHVGVEIASPLMLQKA
jgi:hypothetical protein